jgi:hypothetical protein
VEVINPMVGRLAREATLVVSAALRPLVLSLSKDERWLMGLQAHYERPQEGQAGQSAATVRLPPTWR